MHPVNRYVLDRLVGPLNCVTDEEASVITSPDDEMNTRDIIKLVVKPYFDSLPKRSQFLCKHSLQYFLTSNRAPFFEILSNQQEWQVGAPSDPKAFFVWIWRELFPSEDYHLSDLAKFEECNDQYVQLYDDD